ncbi:MAG: hypothetical protein ACRDON_09330 [Gaiellaceae bacterium]
MRPLLLLALAAAALAITGCGGNDAAEAQDAEPLTLEQRVPNEADAPGWKPDPVETQRTATGVDQFLERFEDQFVNPTAEDERKFKRAGFASAISFTRFLPSEPGGPHTRSASHLAALVMRFETEEGAKAALELLHADSLRPCPESCASQVSEFDVDGIPDAIGVRRYATAESIEETNDPGEPYDSYGIGFADGPFVYSLALFGPPGKVSEEEAKDLAETFYDRVQGAPPP